MIKTAIIIAGGESTRLKPLTDEKPKTMIPVNGKPILYWIIKWLKHHKIRHIVLGVGYKKEKIYEFMEENRNFKMEVDFSEDKISGGGTAHAFRCAIGDYIHEGNFIGMNSDELTNMNLSRLIKKHERYKPLVTMALSPFYCRFSVVKLQKGLKITDFEYGEKLWSVPVSMGVYALNRGILESLPEKGSIEDSLFTHLATNKGKIIGDMLNRNETWVSVNTQKDIKEADAFIKSLYLEKATKTRKK
ncbi:MAG: nucleotidyltransferase family protein [Candidatus Micrarchaeota archaeon]|nr:nucleotidyltransferase family protein [Candidatus Micrarchaeota archaeon]